ncbi:heterokaryon incompatibility protein-domain-containing protein [Paraphoma chrysanthemicola]|uniref:Heterokaryon incompatibility protein-domain-containing protein n=1 Tax=Paraphoma chrysanthemicola TaxID=798071 RepID=A0A8K0VRA7_9PLEO|nr:heterokaryon incompatibility protein-domain-containing protein [Paraphoma chrysanthemicola]
MSASVYPTRLQGRNIRILELFPKASNEELRCRLIETPLDDAPPYQALSYVWGDPTIREPIWCNGERMDVTINLANALRRLRPLQSETELNYAKEDATSPRYGDDDSATLSHASTRWVWADAICINQNDIVERSSQVQLMREVYSKSTEVAIWLGLDPERHARNAFAAIELIAHFLSTYGKLASDLRKEGVKWNNQGRGHFTFELCDALLKSKSIENPWPSLRALFVVQYWTRIWCVQEVFLAPKKILYFGTEEIDGKSFRDFTDWWARENFRHTGGGLSRTKEQIIMQNSGISQAHTTFIHQSLNAKDLFLVCDQFNNLDATNPRDKVYGVLGLWRPPSASHRPIEVDYNKSVAEVYTDVVIQAICDRKDLLVLRLVDHDTDRNFGEDDGFPSWVPRWDRRSRIPFMWLDKSPLSATAYWAEMPDEALARTGILKLKGVLFDRVASTTNVLQGGSASFMNDTSFRNSFVQLYLEATGAKPDPEFRHQVSISELATTVTGGMIKTSDDLHDRDETEPDAWLDISDLDSEAGRSFLYNFQSFVDSDTYPGNPRSFDKLLACQKKRIFRTSRGYLGLGPRSMREGDLVVVLHGGRMPFVLRLMGQPGAAYFVLVGDCFVHDIMQKQIYDMLEEEGVMTGEFQLR